MQLSPPQSKKTQFLPNIFSESLEQERDSSIKVKKFNKSEVKNWKKGKKLYGSRTKVIKLEFEKEEEKERKRNLD